MLNELSIGVSAIRAAQVGLNAVGQNLANADTPGYHRQVVHLANNTPTRIGDLYFGNGVQVEEIRQIRHNVLEQAIFENISAVSDSETRLTLARRVEALLTPGQGSLTDRLDELFGGIESLSSDPSERVRREGVLAVAEGLTNGLRGIADELSSLSSEVQLQVRETVGRINELSAEVADLNERIQIARLSGAAPNDLVDRRDSRVAELATLIDTDLLEGENSVVIADGPTIFETDNYPILQVEVDGLRLGITREGGAPVTPHAGKLAALLSIVNDVLPALQDNLDEVARGLVATIDHQHVQGVGIAGAFDVLTNQRAISDINAPLAELDTVLPITNGEIMLAINGPGEGERVMHSIAIDASSESVSDIVAKLDAIDHFSAFVTTSGTLTLRAEPGYTFDFTGAVPSSLDTAGLSGTAAPAVTGTYRGSTNDTFTVEFLGSGTVGVTEGLIAQVTDSNGAVVAQLDVGLGYGLDQPLLMRDGLSLSLSSGNVVAGESFSIPAVADSDTSSFLTSMGLNTFFTGDSASTLQVSEALRKNSDLLATSRDGNTEDATNINRMTLRRSIATTDGDRLSVEQFTQLFVAELGRQVEQHDEMTTHLSLVGTNLVQQQSAVSGVDPNEELVHMLQFQRSFQTAARYITVISDVTAELMNIIR